MPALVAGIHVCWAARSKAWMAWTSRAMTRVRRRPCRGHDLALVSNARLNWSVWMPRAAKLTRVSRVTREKIIKAASRAFARDGYEGASIRAIVAEAEVNQAAINYHF